MAFGFKNLENACKRIAASSIEKVLSTARGVVGKKAVKTNIPTPPSGTKVQSSKVSTSPSAIVLAKKIKKTPEEIFEKAKKDFLSNLENHKVSRELKAGPTGSSSFLTSGDLFSFMGFEAGSSPVEDLVNFLDESIVFEGYSGLSILKLVMFHFRVKIPNREDFAKREELNLYWENGNPWPFAIEEGVAGYSNYIPLGKDNSKSVSLRGFQNKNKIRQEEFVPIVGYISHLLEEFKQSLKKSGFKVEFF